MKRFIVSGLPRSGTAWASLLLSRCTGVFCWHEAVQHGDLFRTYEAVFEAPEAEITGDATTCTLQTFDDFEATRVWIDRNPDDCRASYAKEIGEELVEATWPTILSLGLKWRMSHHPREVSFARLFSDDFDAAFLEARRLVLYCTGHNLLSKNDFLAMRQLHVQIHGLSATYYDERTIITELDAPVYMAQAGSILR